ncbi:MAG: RNA polymerase sigma factor [Planctomycetales bacterium]
MQVQPANQMQVVLRDQGHLAWGLIVRILGDDGDDAADCYQQSFYELASRQARVNDIRHAGSLWKRIAAARAIDTIRRRISDRERTRLAGDIQVVTDPKTGPAAQAQESELLDAFRAALATIPEVQASAFLLTQVDDLSNQDAAQVLGVSVNHLGVLLHRARVALRTRLESHNPVKEHRP